MLCLRNIYGKLLTTVPPSWLNFIFWALIGSAIIRIPTSIWRYLGSGAPSCDSIFKIFIGIGYKVTSSSSGETKGADYLLGYFLGALELMAYSLCIKALVPEYIGAWLAFKTINRWHYAPNIDRGFFNRYLFANALVLTGAFLMVKTILT